LAMTPSPWLRGRAPRRIGCADATHRAKIHND
jgi:hypothetical protein